MDIQNFWGGGGVGGREALILNKCDKCWTFTGPVFSRADYFYSLHQCFPKIKKKQQDLVGALALHFLPLC